MFQGFCGPQFSEKGKICVFDPFFPIFPHFFPNETLNPPIIQFYKAV